MRSSMRMTSEKIQDWKDEIRLFCWGVFAIACYLVWKVVGYLRLDTWKRQFSWPAFTTCRGRLVQFGHDIEGCSECLGEHLVREAEADVALELAAELDDYIASVPAEDISDDVVLAEMPDDPRW